MHPLALFVTQVLHAFDEMFVIKLMSQQEKPYNHIADTSSGLLFAQRDLLYPSVGVEFKQGIAREADLLQDTFQ